jgi:hypothetical protein
MKKINEQVKLNRESRLNEMIDIAQQIQQLNPGFLLSGSVALYLQGCDIRRQPEDIDFFIPTDISPINPIMPEGYKEEKLIFNEDHTYEDCDFVRMPFKKQGCPKVEFFYYNGEGETDKSENVFLEHYSSPMKLRMIDKVDIMQLKITHAMSDQGNPLKHKLDIIHFLTNN